MDTIALSKDSLFSEVVVEAPLHKFCSLGLSFFGGCMANWELIADEYGTSEGYATIRYWVKKIQGEHITLEVVAGDHRGSTPNEYREDPTEYTTVTVRASSNATGVFLSLSDQADEVQAPVTALTDILNALEAYSGTRYQAHTCLAEII